MEDIRNALRLLAPRSAADFAAGRTPPPLADSVASTSVAMTPPDSDSWTSVEEPDDDDESTDGGLGGGGVFACGVCWRLFGGLPALRSHARVHSFEGSGSAGLTERVVVRRSPVADAEVLRPPPYSCGACGVEFVLGRDLVDHCRRVHGEGDEADGEGCDVCNQQLSDPRILRAPPRIHAGGRACPRRRRAQQQQGKTASPPRSDDELLKKLYDRSCFLGLLFWCDVCGSKYNGEEDLRKHLAKAHADKKPYCCSRCGKKFGNGERFAAHRLVHAGKRLYCCHQCGKKFVNREKLTAHSMVHSGKRHSFACEDCDRKFLYKKSLANHKRTHLPK